MRSKPDPVDQPERTAHYDCAMCIAEMLHNTTAERQFCLIFPFLQTNITAALVTQQWQAVETCQTQWHGLSAPNTARRRKCHLYCWPDASPHTLSTPTSIQLSTHASTPAIVSTTTTTNLFYIAFPQFFPKNFPWLSTTSKDHFPWLRNVVQQCIIFYFYIITTVVLETLHYINSTQYIQYTTLQ